MDAFETREKRIAHVAETWRFGLDQMRRNQEHSAQGFSDEEIELGCKLGQAMDDERCSNNCYYGRPEYGSRNIRHTDLAVSDLVYALRDSRAALIPSMSTMRMPAESAGEDDMEMARRLA